MAVVVRRIRSLISQKGALHYCYDVVLSSDGRETYHNAEAYADAEEDLRIEFQMVKWNASRQIYNC